MISASHRLGMIICTFNLQQNWRNGGKICHLLTRVAFNRTDFERGGFFFCQADATRQNSKSGTLEQRFFPTQHLAASESAEPTQPEIMERTPRKQDLHLGFLDNKPNVQSICLGLLKMQHRNRWQTCYSRRCDSAIIRAEPSPTPTRKSNGVIQSHATLPKRPSLPDLATRAPRRRRPATFPMHGPTVRLHCFLKSVASPIENGPYSEPANNPHSAIGRN